MLGFEELCDKAQELGYGVAAEWQGFHGCPRDQELSRCEKCVQVKVFADGLGELHFKGLTAFREFIEEGIL
jgi:hypothetical protein